MKITAGKAPYVGFAGAQAIRALGFSWRFRKTGFDVEALIPDLILGFWHGDILMPAFGLRRYPAVVLISSHRDGEVITQVMRFLGRHRTVRGSSTRGGARALLELVKTHGHVPWVITPDGPRGPRGVVQEGAVVAASASGRPLVAAGFAASRHKTLDSWDRFVIPKPFAKIVCHFAEPLSVPPDISKAGRVDFAQQFEVRLRDAHEAAAHDLANW